VHETVVIVTVITLKVPHVASRDRLTIDDLGYRDDGITHLTLRYGFQDRVNVPRALRAAAKHMESDVDLQAVSYFVSRINIEATREPGMPLWRKRLFVAIARNAASPVDYFGLPDERTVTVSSHIEL
jgi:KUP system potassium uptake protein